MCSLDVLIFVVVGGFVQGVVCLVLVLDFFVDGGGGGFFFFILTTHSANFY